VTARSGGFARPELLATPAWLAEQLDRSELRVLDVRWRPDGSGPDAFAAGHIPGATYVDWRTHLSETVRDSHGTRLRLAAPRQLASAFRRAGVGDGASVVIYDDANSLHAARVWWSLRAYGHESARVLDGGYPAWRAEGYDVTSMITEVAPARFTPRLDPRRRLDASDVLGLLGAPDVVILDARAEPEYRGFQGNARRLGHIPGATNVPVGAMHEPGSQRLRSPDDLRRQLARAGVERARRIVCYDGAGPAAARLAFVLALLGYEDVAVYDGGWVEWGERADLPVER
jgi:thiosulfate/3-mercaptopyruvate sulfurtransferase